MISTEASRMHALFVNIFVLETGIAIVLHTGTIRHLLK